MCVMLTCVTFTHVLLNTDLYEGEKPQDERERTSAGESEMFFSALTTREHAAECD